MNLFRELNWEAFKSIFYQVIVLLKANHFMCVNEKNCKKLCVGKIASDLSNKWQNRCKKHAAVSM